LEAIVNNEALPNGNDMSRLHITFPFGNIIVFSALHSRAGMI